MLELNKLYNMDCMEGMKQFPDNYFELAIVDPPYGIDASNMSMGTNLNRKHNGYSGISTADKLRKTRFNQGGLDIAITQMSCDWDLHPPDEAYFKELFRVSQNQIIWGGNYFDLPPTRGIAVWDKCQAWDNFSQVELAWTSFHTPAKLKRLSNFGGSNKE